MFMLFFFFTVLLGSEVFALKDRVVANLEVVDFCCLSQDLTRGSF